ncbi:MAG: hypothetical protein JWP91_1483 [Fibrobacteres bacterium]|nr:hypothetical protein [Fibrobacterota bacterium]
MMQPPDPAGLPASSGKPGEPPGQGKVLRTLSDLMRDISSSRAELQRREAVISDLQRRLQGELQPLRDGMLQVRVDTFRVLGKHLRAGHLNKRAHKTLELALLDLANELEGEFGVDLGEDRNRIFEDAAILEDQEEGGEGDDGDDGDPGRYREGDFDKGREGRGDWASPGPHDAKSGRGQSRKGQGAPPKPGNRDEAIAGDIRALYLMLARALHPDKESDPARLQEKTAWMQKVTAAYAARDLAKLLDILASNPLDAVGPYLSQAPLKTVQGFAKRLRRELEILRTRLTFLEAGLDPLLATLLKNGAVNDTAYNILLNQVKKEFKFMKQRRDIYRTTEGLNGLIEALRTHAWRDLM